MNIIELLLEDANISNEFKEAISGKNCERNATN